MNTSNDPLAMWDNMRTLLRMYGVATMIGDAENRAAITALVAAARTTAESIDTVTGGAAPILTGPNWKTPLRESSASLRAALANFPESKS